MLKRWEKPPKKLEKIGEQGRSGKGEGEEILGGEAGSRQAEKYQAEIWWHKRRGR